MRNGRMLQLALLTAVGLAPAVSAGQQAKRRAVTVADAIRMRRLGDPAYFAGSSNFTVANFSPDGKRFVVVVAKGNLEHNTNEYSLLLFDASQILGASKPRVLLTMSSCSNREAIKGVKWLDDSETLAFLAENPRELPQVYTLNTRTKVLQRRTDHPTAIIAFDTTASADEFIFAADPPREPMGTNEALRKGIVVSTQPLRQLLAGDCYRFVPTLFEGEEIFRKRRGGPEHRVLLDDVFVGPTRLSLSPNGRYALIEAFVRHPPNAWREYANKFIHEYASDERQGEVASLLRQYELLEVQTGAIAPLLEAPVGFEADNFVWAPDGKSLVLSGMYLPLDVPDAAERERRAKHPYVVEISLPNRSLNIITSRDLRVTQWKKNRILLAAADDNEASRVTYEKVGSQWREHREPVRDSARPGVRWKVTLEEDINTPPKIYATDFTTQKKTLLLDLNPQFHGLSFGKVQEVTWSATDGHKVLGGLYLPPDYAAGTRYPLVIQTHGFHRDRFCIDGPWSSAFAAQPLANQGFAVLQLEGRDAGLAKVANTPNEGPYYMAEYEGAIDYLDARGVIDRNQVGIIGFSRTVYAVEYTLTHSKYGFAAATLADGINGGYFSYVVTPNGSDERLNGARPFGDGLAAWRDNSPGFNLDKVRTPVRLEYYGSSATVLGGWEWFSLLSYLHKPVEMIYLPLAPHQLVNPAERMASQQGNVDWFRFWLKGEEDPDPTKRQEYRRWHHLRELQARNEGGLMVGRVN